MNFHVYRVTGVMTATLIASTRYIEDAKWIFNNWNRGYIVTSEGEMIASKGLG